MKVEFPDDFESAALQEALLNLYLRKYTIMAERHRKYGPGNIAASGVAGLIVRIRDKLARIEHTKEHYVDENYFDSWIDLSNYADIAVLYEQGSWPKSETRLGKCPSCNQVLNRALE